MQKKKTVRKKRDAILKGNGQHQALCEVKGVLTSPTEMILTDGTVLQVGSNNPRVRHILKTQKANGLNWFRGYPKLDKENNLTSLELVSWGASILTPPEDSESYIFKGIWLQKHLLVQRDINVPFVAKYYKEKGRIFTFKYFFSNGDYYTKKEKLINNELYLLKAKRKGNKLRICSIQRLEENNGEQ